MIRVIKGGTVITMDENKEQKYEQLDIVIKDNKIKALVEKYDGELDEVINAEGKIVMPGLINCHTHLGMSLFRATNDNLDLDTWLNKKIWPIENQMTEEDIYYANLLSVIEMLESGTTCSNDMYFGGYTGIKALVQTKVRSVFSRTLMDNDGKGKERLADFKNIYYEYKNNDLINFAMTPHAMYTCSKSYLKKCSDVALKLDIPVHMHFCENEDEVKKIKKMYHCDPVKALEKTGLLRNKLILAHGTYISDKGLDILSKHDVSICHNPVSNLNLGCGIADIAKYTKKINICLGTDGQGSGNNMNMFYHMSFAVLLQKGIHKDPTIMSSYDVLKMATINGAKALGLESEIGSIEVGKKADIIILDADHINLYPNTDIITNIAHNIETMNVNTVIINGEVLIRQHKLLLTINKEMLKEKVDAIIKRLNIK